MLLWISIIGLVLTTLGIIGVAWLSSRTRQKDSDYFFLRIGCFLLVAFGLVIAVSSSHDQGLEQGLGCAKQFGTLEPGEIYQVGAVNNLTKEFIWVALRPANQALDDQWRLYKLPNKEYPALKAWQYVQVAVLDQEISFTPFPPSAETQPSR